MSTTQENNQGREVRAIEGTISAAGGLIEGYAAVFNQVTELMPGLREVVRPGAFRRSLEAGDDVRALWNHDANYVLGRRASGTLTVEEDHRGLGYTINPPDAQWARDAQESIHRGDVSQSSFAFHVVVERWTQDLEAGYTLRELLDVDLIDVSPVTYPAYEGTSVNMRAAREARDALARHIASQVRGVGPEFVQEIVDELLGQRQGHSNQAIAEAHAAEELAKAQARMANYRRRLRLQDVTLINN